VYQESKLVKPTAKRQFRFDGKAMYRTGQEIPGSGIYRVNHGSHRLPHEVTLISRALFPRCCKCADEVEFEPVMLARTLVEPRGQIILYELPCIESDADEVSA
jgi:hypothetical protein